LNADASLNSVMAVIAPCIRRPFVANTLFIRHKRYYFAFSFYCKHYYELDFAIQL
jgi:hypothetical protein